MNRVISLVVLLVILLASLSKAEVVGVSVPEKRCDVVVRFTDEVSHTIQFYAPYEFADEMREFGALGEDGSERFYLTVDARYNFKEVVAYIESFSRGCEQ